MTTTNEKITEKSTKGKIYDAYLKAQKQIEALESQQLNPTKILEAKKNENTLTQAAEVADTSVDSVIDTLGQAIDSALTNLKAEFEQKVGTFNNLDEAIKLKQAELEEIYGIQRQADTLAALFDAHEATKKKHDTENQEQLSDHRAKLADLQLQIKNTQEEYIQVLAAQRKKLAQEQERAQSEFDYDFARHKKKKEDELADYIAAEHKAIANEKAAVAAREDAVEKREESIEALEEKVNAIPSLIEEASEAAAEKAKKDAERSAHFERRAIESKKDAEIQVLEHQVDLLKQSLESEKENHAKTADQLAEAYGRLEKVSIASVEGAKQQETVAKLLTMQTEKSSK